MRVLTIFSLFLLGLTFSFTISSASSAQTRSDYLGAYRDWMLPTSSAALKRGPVETEKSIAKVKPRTDYWGPGDSGSFYDFYLDWMYPKRNVGPKPAPAQTTPLTVHVGPRTDYEAGNSGAAYDFYLDWMLPRVKPKTPRTIPFLVRLISRQRSDADSQVVSLENNR